jgi:excisionase family DNA binding protein
MTSTVPSLLTVQEAADRLRLSKQWVYRRINEGKLLGYRIGGVTRVCEESVNNLLTPVTPISQPSSSELRYNPWS